ncbi:MAG: hypothetical protein GXP25_06885 [Planctomycetes bacterium]|nr:hypothetical protein [Planctomycetota bacterium]
MKRLGVALGLLFLLPPACAVAQSGFQGGGKADDDFASYNIRKIGLVVVGKWKGSDAKVEPNVIAMHIKTRLRDKGYDVFDLDPRNRKGLKAAERTQDAILKVMYQAMVASKMIIASADGEREHIDRNIKGVAEMVTTKRVSKKRKTIFKAKGGTVSQMIPAGEPGTYFVGNAPEVFATIVAGIPRVPENAAKKDKGPEEKKKDEKGEKNDQ